MAGLWGCMERTTAKALAANNVCGRQEGMEVTCGDWRTRTRAGWSGTRLRSAWDGLGAARCGNGGLEGCEQGEHVE